MMSKNKREVSDHFSKASQQEQNNNRLRSFFGAANAVSARNLTGVPAMTKEPSLRSLFQKTSNMGEIDHLKPPQRTSSASGDILPGTESNDKIASTATNTERLAEHEGDKQNVEPSKREKVGTGERSRRRSRKKPDASKDVSCSEKSKRVSSRSSRSDRTGDESRRQRSHSKSKRNHRKLDNKASAPVSPGSETTTSTFSDTERPRALLAVHANPLHIEKDAAGAQPSQQQKSVVRTSNVADSEKLSRRRRSVEKTVADRRPTLSKHASASRLVASKRSLLETSKPCSRRNLAGMTLASPKRADSPLATSRRKGGFKHLSRAMSEQSLLVSNSPKNSELEDSPLRKAPVRQPSRDDIMQLSFSGAARPALIRRETGGEIYKLVDGLDKGVSGDPTGSHIVCQLCGCNGHGAKQCPLFCKMKAATTSSGGATTQQSNSNKTPHTGNEKNQPHGLNKKKKSKSQKKERMFPRLLGSKEDGLSMTNRAAYIPPALLTSKLEENGTVEPSGVERSILRAPSGLNHAVERELKRAPSDEINHDDFTERSQRKAPLRAPTGDGLDHMAGPSIVKPLLRGPTGEGLAEMCMATAMTE